MLGVLYERALAGEQCWIRRQDGEVLSLPVEHWLGGDLADGMFDNWMRPGRLVAELARDGICALGVDQSAVAVELARRRGASAVRCDIFIDRNVGIGGDPHRLLDKVRELVGKAGRCLVEFDATTTGIRKGMVRPESARHVGPWFPWATVGLDSAEQLARDCGFEVERVCTVDDRVVASLTGV
jgi:hypothetical protein